MTTDELNDGELDELECMRKIRILPGLLKMLRIMRIDELNNDEFNCI